MAFFKVGLAEVAAGFFVSKRGCGFIVMEEEEEQRAPQQEEPVVDPRFVRHFGLQIWKRVQEKEYFEQRKAYREWWWNHTVVLAWRCLTWAHLAILFAGTLSVAKALFWIRINWFLLSIVAESTCLLGSITGELCFDSSPANMTEAVQLILKCENLTAPLTNRFGHLLTCYDPAYLYTWIPKSLESMVVGPFVLFAWFFRYYSLHVADQFPWLYLTGMVCVK